MYRTCYWNMNLHFTGREAMALLCQDKVAMDSILKYMPGFVDFKKFKNHSKITLLYSVTFSSNRNLVEMVCCYGL